MDKLNDFIKNMKIKTVLYGGFDKEDVYKHFKELIHIFQEIIDASQNEDNIKEINELKEYEKSYHKLNKQYKELNKKYNLLKQSQNIKIKDDDDEFIKKQYQERVDELTHRFMEDLQNVEEENTRLKDELLLSADNHYVFLDELRDKK